VLRTQLGNNNAYCQDNDLGWFDWRLVEQNAAMLRYTRELIALRRRHPSLTANRYFTGAPVPGRDIVDVAWHGTHLNEPLWHDPDARVLACTIAGLDDAEPDLHVILNMSEQGLDAPLPEVSRRDWHIALDTAQAAPADILEQERQVPLVESSCRVKPRSVVVLEARA
jgi:glycogen operon protein